MGFLKKFGIIFNNKKNIGLPAATELSNEVATSTSAFSVASVPNASLSSALADSATYKTIAMFDLNIESPKFEGAIPEASVKFYPIK